MKRNPPKGGSFRRLGGEFPAFSDRLGRAQQWQSNWLAFSHGRAALAWLLDRRPAKSALVCAYTCPTVPAFLRRRGLALEFFDVGASERQLTEIAAKLPSPCLVLVPALFGMPPWLDAHRLQAALAATAMVVIDAAQNAFAHVDFVPPKGGAVLSCPRKCTEIADGAVLALAKGLGIGTDVARLPTAKFPAAMKAAARAIWATGDPKLEHSALKYNRLSEESWPDMPHRMSDVSRALLLVLDRSWHAERRRRNYRILAKALIGRIAIWKPAEGGVPFSLPIFVRDSEATLASLRGMCIFASALWPDAELDPTRHEVAAWMARHLVSLPVDQRHDDVDMQRIAKAVLVSAEPSASAPPPPLGRWIGKGATTRSGRRRQ